MAPIVLGDFTDKYHRLVGLFEDALEEYVGVLSDDSHGELDYCKESFSYFGMRVDHLARYFRILRKNARHLSIEGLSVTWRIRHVEDSLEARREDDKGEVETDDKADEEFMWKAKDIVDSLKKPFEAEVNFDLQQFRDDYEELLNRFRYFLKEIEYMDGYLSLLYDRYDAFLNFARTDIAECIQAIQLLRQEFENINLLMEDFDSKLFDRKFIEATEIGYQLSRIGDRLGWTY